ncbi:MAG: BTAD domain-containing putative transcriptional regulator, partial [Ktedonobacteraceae bacterium]
MDTPSLLRKITVPPLPPTILPRAGLAQRLSKALTGSSPDTMVGPALYKLALVHAPAGYGKTTLLVEVARQIPLPCCWYFLERSDSEPLIFLRLLLASLKQRFPTFGEQLVPLFNVATETSTESSYMLLDALVAAISREIPERFVLLLCHYQEVSEYPEITALVQYLLHHLPEQGVLVLESREVPELDFASLLAGRAMLGIGQDLLRFSPQEIRALAQVQGSRPLSEEEAEQLVSAFDGWITGLLLGTRLGDVQFLQRDWSTPLSRKGLGVHIYAQTLFSYVVNEVFKHHQAVYTFLKEAVVLEEMNPGLCAAMLKMSSKEAGKHLRYLEHHGLFVTHSGEEPDVTYTCHPVLRDLLCEELRQRNPERFVQLHQRAAELLSVSQHYEQAIYHAMEASVDEIAAQLITSSAEQLIEQGHMETLQRWITDFSETTTTRYPKLLLIQANIYLRKSELSKVQPLLEQLTSLLSAPPLTMVNREDLPLLQVELALAHVLALTQEGKYQQAQPLCQQVLEQLPADEVSLRARAHISFGMCAGFLGEPSIKISHYQKALQLWGRHTISRQTADGHSMLAETYRLLGHFALAEHHSKRATACWEQLQDIRGTVNNLIIRASLIWDQGKLDEAERILQQALTLATSPFHLHRLEGYALVSLGELSQVQGLDGRSLAMTEEGLALARQLGDAWLLNYALLTLALAYLYMGDATTASLLLSEMRIEKSTGVSANSEQQVLRDLAEGTIRLHQRHYTDALSLLEPAEAALSTMGFKQEQLKALLRLAACHLAQKQLPTTLKLLSEVERILTTVDSYEWRVFAELRVSPQLRRTIEMQQECSSLRALLHWEEGVQERTIEEVVLETPSFAQALQPAPITTPIVTPRLKIIALGEPVVLLDGSPITHWRMARAMELCFYLLECGRPMRKEQIITSLWEEVDEQLSQTFYSTIHYLRKALGGESAIKSRAGIYTLDVASLYGEGGVWYDVAAFMEHYTLGKRALEGESEETARAAFEAMVDLYRGDYVQPFYSDWCTLRRDELRRTYLDARQQLAQIAWRAEEIEVSAAHWQQMLAVDTCLEEA